MLGADGGRAAGMDGGSPRRGNEVGTAEFGAAGRAGAMFQAGAAGTGSPDACATEAGGSCGGTNGRGCALKCPNAPTAVDAPSAVCRARRAARRSNAACRLLSISAAEQ
eukprot:scaffold20371_cov102-Isochrysis_galbana.AAC.3